jgi:hypothetical protein
MDFVHFGIMALAALMVWLFYKATREMRALGAQQRKYAPRHARSRNSGEEHIGGRRKIA